MEIMKEINESINIKNEIKVEKEPFEFEEEMVTIKYEELKTETEETLESTTVIEPKKENIFMNEPFHFKATEEDHFFKKSAINLCTNLQKIPEDSSSRQSNVNNFNGMTVIPRYILPEKLDRFKNWQLKDCESDFSSEESAVENVTFQPGMSFNGKNCKEILEQQNKSKSIVNHLIMYTCELCNKSFKQKGNLKQHISTHSDEKPFVCENCGNKFKTKTDLKRHRLHHFKTNKFVCEICEKLFVSKSNLRKHINSHSNVRSFACEICENKFKTKYQLKSHMLIHSEDKPFLCEICKNSFKTKPSLKKHKLSHSDVKPFCCEKCDVSFKTKYGLQYHIFCHSYQ